MQTNSFTITPSLKTKLASIEKLYSEIMVVAVPPKIETQIRQQSLLAHLEGWVGLANQPLSRQHLIEILGKFQSKHANSQVAKVLSYKDAVNYIRDNWTANPTPVTFETVYELSKILGVNCGSREVVEPVLTYLHANNLHPVFQSALAHLAFYPNRLAYLLSLLYLAKTGLDLRGWLSLEDCWNQNKTSYLQVLQQTTTSKNSTLWLEYYCQGLIVQMTAVKTELGNLLTVPIQSTSKSINSRQKNILEMAIQSPTPITNRQVQQIFKVSQITASRDLSKLSLVGLLAPHGSGRSTSYTKM